MGKVDRMSKRCKDHGRRTEGSTECPDCMADLDEELAASSIPSELHAISDVVLAYKPKPKSKGAKRRTRKAKKISQKESDDD